MRLLGNGRARGLRSGNASSGHRRPAVQGCLAHGNVQCVPHPFHLDRCVKGGDHVADVCRDSIVLDNGVYLRLRILCSHLSLGYHKQ